MVDTFNTHDQGEAVKKWLQENGSAIVMGLVIAFGGLFGFKQWQAWQETSKQQASYEYELLNLQLAENQLDAAMDHFQTLRDEHGKSPYASMAALVAAKMERETGNLDAAAERLDWVIENSATEELRMLSRLRLAGVRLDQQRYDEALTLLDEKVTQAFVGPYSDMRGDVLAAQGKVAEAKAAYQKALDSSDEKAAWRDVVQIKLDALSNQ